MSAKKKRRPTLLSERKYTVTLEIHIQTPRLVHRDDVFEMWDVTAQDTDAFQDLLDQWAESNEDMKHCVVVSTIVDVTEDT